MLDKKTFYRFRLGLGLFFTGLALIYSAQQLLEPSLQQEIMVAAAALIAAIGFGIAVIAELQFLWQRFKHLFR